MAYDKLLRRAARRLRAEWIHLYGPAGVPSDQEPTNLCRIAASAISPSHPTARLLREEGWIQSLDGEWARDHLGLPDTPAGKRRARLVTALMRDLQHMADEARQSRMVACIRVRPRRIDLETVAPRRFLDTLPTGQS